MQHPKIVLARGNNSLTFVEDSEALHSPFRYTDLLDFCRNEQLVHKTVTCNNLSEIYSLLIHNCILTCAAGGVVLDKSKKVLMIYRRDKWDLPKGKVEYNESLEEAAVREVKEETGIESKIEKKFYITKHLYVEKNTVCMKITHWYLMDALSHVTKPQLEEDITAVKWTNIKEAKSLNEKTYLNIHQLLQRL